MFAQFSIPNGPFICHICRTSKADPVLIGYDSYPVSSGITRIVIPVSGIWYLMTLKAAFMFVAPGADPGTHRSVITTPEVELITVGVSDYAMAAAVTRNLVSDGVQAIELCGGFGIEGTAIVKQATDGKAVVGVVRFDTHPGLLNKSGDELFG